MVLTRIQNAHYLVTQRLSQRTNPKIHCIPPNRLLPMIFSPCSTIMRAKRVVISTLVWGVSLAKLPGEASVMVDKTIRYSSADARGDWRNRICFIADDEDGNIHVRDTETLVDIVNE
jgi:hypothetical protein